MLSWTEILDRAEPEEHVVQVYGNADQQFLIRNVARYLAEGLRRGDGLVVIATPGHIDAILRQLQADAVDPSTALRSGQFICLDAQAVLDQFMRGGQPDRVLFESVVGGVLADVRARVEGGHIRAFGEMVGLLWVGGHQAEAARLEEYWDELIKGNGFSLFCAYPIDIFGDHFEMATLGAVLHTHTHLLAGSQTMLSSVRVAG